MSTYLYRTAFSFNLQFGYAAAMGTVMMLASVALALVTFRLTNREEIRVLMTAEPKTAAPTAADRTTAEPTAPERLPGHSWPSRLLGKTPQLVLVIWALVVAVPLLWILMSSLKTNVEIYNSPFGPPGELRLHVYARAWAESNIGAFFLNTVLVVAGGVLLTMTLSAMTAYVMARYPFRGSRVLYWLYLAGMTFPVFLAIVPLVRIVQALGLFATPVGLILVYAAFSLPFSIFFLTAFFRTLPRKSSERRRSSTEPDTSGVFFRIMLPLARPGLISIGVFNFLGQWNQFLLPKC